MILPTNDEWVKAIESAPDLRPNSKKSYLKHMRALLRLCDISSLTGLTDIMFDCKRFMPCIETLPVCTQRIHLIAIVSLFKRGEEAHFFRRSDEKITLHHRGWMEELADVRGKHRKRIDANEPSQREIEAHATVDEWKTAYSVIQDEKPDSQEALLLAFHALMLPPLRGGDLSHVRLGRRETGNCLYVEDNGDAKLLIRDHKTSRQFPELTRVLPKKLLTLLLNSIEKDKRDWLFTPKSKAAYSDSGYSTWKYRVLHRAFQGRRVTSNSLRHSFISEMDRQNQTIGGARNVAHAMGHSVYMQREYVRFQPNGQFRR